MAMDVLYSKSNSSSIDLRDLLFSSRSPNYTCLTMFRKGQKWVFVEWNFLLI